MDYPTTEKDDTLLDNVLEDMLDDIDVEPPLAVSEPPNNQCPSNISISKILLDATRTKKFLEEKASMARSAHQQQDFLSDLTMTSDLHREISANFCSKAPSKFLPSIFMHNFQTETATGINMFTILGDRNYRFSAGHYRMISSASKNELKLFMRNIQAMYDLKSWMAFQKCLNKALKSPLVPIVKLSRHGGGRGGVIDLITSYVLPTKYEQLYPYFYPLCIDAFLRSSNRPGLDGTTKLYEAARLGLPNTLQLLLTLTNPPTNTFSRRPPGSQPLRSGFQHTPLHMACLSGSAESVRVLLNHGADPNATTDYGEVPLNLACESPQARVETIQLLLDHGADVNLLPDDPTDPNAQTSQAPQTPQTPQTFQIGGQTVQAIFQQPTFNSTGQMVGMAPAFPPRMKQIYSPLFTACCMSEIQDMDDIIKLLFERGAKDTLVCASLRGDLNAIENMLNDESVDVNLEQMTYTPLCAAAKGGHVDACALLIEKGKAGVNLSCKMGLPIHCAALNGRKKRTTKLRNTGHPDCIRCLAHNRSAMNHLNPAGNTPLYEACTSNCLASVIALLEFSTTKVDHVCHGMTALFTAVINASPEIVLALIQHGANVNMVSKCLYNVSTPLHMGLAQYMPRLPGNPSPPLAPQERHQILKNINILIKNGANVNFPHPQSGNTALHLCSLEYFLLKPVLETDGVNLNAQDFQGSTALMKSSLPGATDSKCVGALLEAGADASLLDTNRRSALFVAAGAIDAVGVEIVKLLLDTGQTNVNLKSGGYNATNSTSNHLSRNLTPLFAACQTAALRRSPLSVFKEVVALLFSHGADPNIVCDILVSNSTYGYGTTPPQIKSCTPIDMLINPGNNTAGPKLKLIKAFLESSPVKVSVLSSLTSLRQNINASIAMSKTLEAQEDAMKNTLNQFKAQEEQLKRKVTNSKQQTTTNAFQNGCMNSLNFSESQKTNQMNQMHQMHQRRIAVNAQITGKKTCHAYLEEYYYQSASAEDATQYRNLSSCACCLRKEPPSGKFKKCKCKQVVYCNATCQKEHWKNHKKEHRRHLLKA